MIFSSKIKNIAGQTLLESILSLVFVMSSAFVVLFLLINLLSLLAIKKWAAQNSRCFAVSEELSSCRENTTRELKHFFVLKDPKVFTAIHRGVISTTIKAVGLAHMPLAASYDLIPFEYKRVSK